MEGYEFGKKTRRRPRPSELKNVGVVDLMDPVATAFTCGQYGHGSRIFAKVVDRVTARLEARLSRGGGGEHASEAATAVAAKLNEAWREMYNRPLPSEAKVKQELARLSRRELRDTHGIEQIGPVRIATNSENRSLVASSDRWYAGRAAAAAAAASAAATRRHAAAPTGKKKREASAEAADCRPKRRFVLKVAKRRFDSGGSSDHSAVRRRRPLRRDVAGAATADDRPEGKSGYATAAEKAERLADSVGAGTSAAGSVAVGEFRVADGDAGDQVGVEQSRAEVHQQQATVDGGAENAAAEGRRLEEQGTPAAEPATERGATGRGVEQRMEEEEEEEEGGMDSAFGPRSSPPPPSLAAIPAAATPAEAEGNEERSEEEQNLPRCRADGENDEEDMNDGGGGGGGGGGDALEGACAGQVDREERSPTAEAPAPDVILTANYVGDFQKRRGRQTWKLDLEGVAVEGEGQVFVFDKCECWLQPPK